MPPEFVWGFRRGKQAGLDGEMLSRGIIGNLTEARLQTACCGNVGVLALAGL